MWLRGASRPTSLPTAPCARPWTPSSPPERTWRWWPMTATGISVSSPSSASPRRSCRDRHRSGTFHPVGLDLGPQGPHLVEVPPARRADGLGGCHWPCHLVAAGHLRPPAPEGLYTHHMGGRVPVHHSKLGPVHDPHPAHPPLHDHG